MVEDVEFVAHRHASALQVPDRADDVGVAHVPARVVVSADNKNAMVLSLGGADNTVEDEKVFVIPGQQYELLLERVEKMPGVRGAGQTGRRRQDYQMAGLA